MVLRWLGSSLHDEVFEITLSGGVMAEEHLKVLLLVMVAGCEAVLLSFLAGLGEPCAAYSRLIVITSVGDRGRRLIIKRRGDWCICIIGEGMGVCD